MDGMRDMSFVQYLQVQPAAASCHPSRFKETIPVSGTVSTRLWHVSTSDRSTVKKPWFSSSQPAAPNIRNWARRAPSRWMAAA